MPFQLSDLLANKQIAGELLSRQGMVFPPEVEDLPWHLVAGLMKAELDEAMNVERHYLPFMVAYLDKLEEEFENLSHSVRKRVVKSLIYINSGDLRENENIEGRTNLFLLQDFLKTSNQGTFTLLMKSFGRKKIGKYNQLRQHPLWGAWPQLGNMRETFTANAASRFALIESAAVFDEKMDGKPDSVSVLTLKHWSKEVGPLFAIVDAMKAEISGDDEKAFPLELSSHE